VIRQAIVCLLAVTLCGLSLVADEPKRDESRRSSRKKKKDDPKPEEKPAPKKDVEPKDKVEPREKVRPRMTCPPTPTPIRRPSWSASARTSASPRTGSARRTPAAGTQQVQRDIVKDMDSLIQRVKQTASNSSRPEGFQGSERSKDQKNAPPAPRTASNSRAQRQAPPSRRSAEARRGEKNGNQSTQARTVPRATTAAQPGGLDKKADNSSRTSGAICRMMRQEMDAYSREQFAAKYNENAETVLPDHREKADARRRSHEPHALAESPTFPDARQRRPACLTSAAARRGQPERPTRARIGNLITEGAQRCIDQGLDYLVRARHEDGSFGDRVPVSRQCSRHEPGGARADGGRPISRAADLTAKLSSTPCSSCSRRKTQSAGLPALTYSMHLSTFDFGIWKAGRCGRHA